MLSPESRQPVVAQAAWLSIIGIGEDGLTGLGQAALAALSAAEHVFGGKRHLQLAARMIKGKAHSWSTPFDPSMREVLALSGQKVCILASGDPFHYGVGVTLARLVSPAEFNSYPAPSAFSLAAARLGWALQNVDCISLHGRPIDTIRPLLQPAARILALTSDEAGPAKLAQLLSDNGFAESRIMVLEALGGDKQQIRSQTAAQFSLTDIDPLNLVAIDVVADAEARVLPYGFGLADALFEHDGQITKREIRAVTLSALAPQRGELLWDVGAGSGSIALEWLHAHPSMRAIAIERDPIRAARIRRNAAQMGRPDLQIIEGAAPEALTGLVQPDVIFIGGGGSNDDVLPVTLAALKPGGRLVANGVTLQMQSLLVEAQAQLGGSLTSIAIAHNSAIGSMQALRPALPVLQWSYVKPC